MTPAERNTVEASAERSVRRGELAEALRLYQRLIEAFPADRALKERLRLLKESLQPAELVSPKANFRPEPMPAAQLPVDTAEALAARGEYAEAIAVYRRLLAEKPDSDLLKERLAELFALAQAQPPRPAAEPREAFFAELLARISTRRRDRKGGW